MNLRTAVRIRSLSKLTLFGAASALWLLAGCGGGGGGGDGGGGSDDGGGGGGSGTVSGTVLFDSSSARRASLVRPLVREDEPNDRIDQATRVGELRVGDRIEIAGHGSAGHGIDPLDGFEVRVPERVRLKAELRSTDGAADFDLAIFDPTSLEFVARFATDGAAETGTFLARGTFDLVVQAFSGDGDYSLTLTAEPASDAVPAAGLDPAFAGDLLAGDVLRIAPVEGSLLVACPASVRLLSDADGVAFFDATEDVLHPTLVGTGAIDVDAGTLLVVRVPAGLLLPNLVLRAEPRAEARTAPALSRAERTGRIAPLSVEFGRFRRPSDVFFGQPATEMRAGEGLVSVLPGLEDATALEFSRRSATADAPTPNGHALVRFGMPMGLSSVDGARLTLSRLLSLRSAPGVVYADPNHRRRIRATPNDSRYGEQWDLPQINCPKAWDVTTGSSSVIVAVIDTGETKHPDLAGRLVQGYDFISDAQTAGDGNGRDGDPTDVGDGEDGEPGSYHGTHVAGTIGAATNNGAGVAGVTWGCKVMQLRVLGIGGGDDADIIEAIRYAAGLSNATGKVPAQRANVINMSLGGGGFDQAMQNAVTAARNAGVVICAAAGNSGTSEKEYPASFDGVLSIAATDRNKNRTSYSNANSMVDVAAPGGDSSNDEADGILSTIYDDSVSPKQATYAFYDGTSMATPHVAGVAALVFSVAPTLSAEQVESILLGTATDRGTAGRDNQYGYGLVDAYAAVVAARDGQVPAPPPPGGGGDDGGGDDGGGGGGGDDPVDTSVYVLLIDADTDETAGEAVVEEGGSAAFTMDGVPAGSYYVVAGSDHDGDGYIGDAGDWYGAYGDPDDPTVFSLSDGGRVRSVRVTVSRDASSSSAGRPRHVHRPRHL